MENLQLVLTGDKGVATDLTIFLSASERDLLVYLGVALLERVEYNPNQFAYKMLIGRLVNAGVALAKLNGQFKHDSRTMKKWAEALKSDDPDVIVRAFAGRGPLPKVIGPMIRLVKMRYLSLKGVVRNYRQIIAREVEECFGETISRETLRHLFNLARKEQEAAANDDSEDDGVACEQEDEALSEDCSAAGNTALNSVDTMANGCPLKEISSSNESLNDKYSTNFLPVESQDSFVCLQAGSTVAETSVVKVASAGRDDGTDIDLGVDQSSTDTDGGAGSQPPSVPTGLPYSNQQPSPQFRAVQHAGQILFSPWLDMVGFQRPQARGLQSQWIGQILQGAVNIEQSHLICATSLALFTGPVLTGLKAQRVHLKEMGDAAAVLDIYRANTRLLPDGPGMGSVFYYDPHSKECWTLLTMLKGWCGRRHSIAKVLHLDFIHTESGLPCFLQHYDNFYDLRERFFISLSLFGKLFPKMSSSGSTFILDRGIFGQDVFSKFGEHGCSLITWEKGYEKDGWDAEWPAIMFQRFRERNHPGDLKEYSFECQESPWPKDASIRRIIVRATNLKGNTIEVSILCTNPDMSVQRIVTLIFNRWIQENGFKYLDCYFGLMQITSYVSEKYKDIADTLTDRWVVSPEYRELKRLFAAEEQALGKLLLKRERQTKRLETSQEQRAIVCQTVTDTEEEIDVLRKRLKAPKKSQKLGRLQRRLKELRSQRSRLKSQETRLRKQLEALAKTIEEKKESLSKVDDKLELTLREKSRLEGLIEDAYQRPDIRRKALMDALRVTAHNMFRNMMAIFRPIYGNYRNDHVMLRMLTRTDGFMWTTDTAVQIRLWLKGRYAGHLKKTFQTFISAMADCINGHFAGRAKKVQIEIVDTTDQFSTPSQNHGVQLVTRSPSMT
jgi:predicted  nucleic acid-binding Zn-ribbon protein